MDQTYLAAELGRLGILPGALQDALGRAERHFTEHADDEGSVAAWTQELPRQAPHLFGKAPLRDEPDDEADELPWESLGITREEWYRYSPATKLAMAREALADEPPEYGREQRRPQAPRMTEARQRELDGLTQPQARLTAYRRMQAEDAQQGGQR